MNRAEYELFINELFGDMKGILSAKNADYADHDNPFANFSQSVDFGVEPLIGLFIRMGDKMQRLKAWSLRGTLEVRNEGIEDALKDIIGYATLGLAMMRDEEMFEEHWKKFSDELYMEYETDLEGFSLPGEHLEPTDESRN